MKLKYIKYKLNLNLFLVFDIKLISYFNIRESYYQNINNVYYVNIKCEKNHYINSLFYFSIDISRLTYKFII